MRDPVFVLYFSRARNIRGMYFTPAVAYAFPARYLKSSNKLAVRMGWKVKLQRSGHGISACIRIRYRYWFCSAPNFRTGILLSYKSFYTSWGINHSKILNYLSGARIDPWNLGMQYLAMTAWYPGYRGGRLFAFFALRMPESGWYNVCMCVWLLVFSDCESSSKTRKTRVVG